MASRRRCASDSEDEEGSLSPNSGAESEDESLSDEYSQSEDEPESPAITAPITAEAQASTLNNNSNNNNNNPTSSSGEGGAVTQQAQKGRGPRGPRGGNRNDGAQQQQRNRPQQPREWRAKGSPVAPGSPQPSQQMLQQGQQMQQQGQQPQRGEGKRQRGQNRTRGGERRGSANRQQTLQPAQSNEPIDASVVQEDDIGEGQQPKQGEEGNVPPRGLFYMHDDRGNDEPRARGKRRPQPGDRTQDGPWRHDMYDDNDERRPRRRRQRRAKQDGAEEAAPSNGGGRPRRSRDPAVATDGAPRTRPAQQQNRGRRAQDVQQGQQGQLPRGGRKGQQQSGQQGGTGQRQAGQQGQPQYQQQVQQQPVKVQSKRYSSQRQGNQGAQFYPTPPTSSLAEAANATPFEYNPQNIGYQPDYASGNEYGYYDPAYAPESYGNYGFQPNAPFYPPQNADTGFDGSSDTASPKRTTLSVKAAPFVPKAKASAAVPIINPASVPAQPGAQPSSGESA